ncbi:Histone-lysine N-methyltransferase SETMAR [Melipona quadrifasciata]|uniref:Histone-lysine N-methyltransferase SETMAR n=1 Tax=Melipona quadrifasciata TaxID=166423 RepID=A0A0M8ZZ89_9HYME|nr:Histone-lysine N-methyltransferase SETMAR [Melipona quadrifasciata]
MSVKYAKGFEAVFLCYHSKGPKMTVRTAAKYLRKSPQFVDKWLQRYKETKCVDDLPDRGSKRVTTETGLMNRVSTCDLLLQRHERDPFLKQPVAEKRLELANRRGDNARPHVALSVRQKLLQFDWDVLPHPPYSPDLAPSDYCLFLSLKNSLRGESFKSISEIKTHLDEYDYVVDQVRVDLVEHSGHIASATGYGLAKWPTNGTAGASFFRESINNKFRPVVQPCSMPHKKKPPGAVVYQSV